MPQNFLIDRLEPRYLLSVTPVDPASAIPFDHIVIDANPGPTPLIKILGDVNNDGKLDAIIGHANGHGIYWYEFPASGNPNDTWTKFTIDPTADSYEEGAVANISGHKDSHGKPVMDLIMEERGTVVWYENPLGDGQDPTTAASWTRHVIGTISQGATHELYLADIDGDGKTDVVTNDAIFFQDTPTSWTQVAAPTYNRTEKGLYLFDSGSGLGAIDLLGTGNAPNYKVGWYENPRDFGGNARTDLWIFRAIGPKYTGYEGGAGISYAEMDVNGDGRQDILTCIGETDSDNDAFTGGLIWWQAPANRLKGTWTEHVIDAGIEDVHNLRIADINGDGTPEIAVAEQDQSDSRRVEILFNVGGAGQNWQSQVLSDEGGHNEWIADDDGDGDLDILSSPHGFFDGFNPIDLFQSQLADDGTTLPKITTQPAAQTAAAGADVVFSITANANADIAYQWLRNGIAIAGATSPLYVDDAISSAENGAVFQCVVSDAAGFVNSKSAKLTVSGKLTTQAHLMPASLSKGGAKTHQLVVNYSGSAADRLLIACPTGDTESAALLSPSGYSAIYSMTAPGGKWDGADDGVYTVSLPTSGVAGTFAVNIAPTTGMLEGSQSVSAVTADYNLTSLSTSDWIDFNGQVRKAGGGSQISDISLINGANSIGGSDSAFSTGWTDGTPETNASADHDFISDTAAVGSGFSFTVPADTTTRSLYVYAGGAGITSKLIAHLSDGSAKDYVLTDTAAGDFSDLYKITYHAASAGQTLAIKLLKDANISGAGSLDLMAAALAAGDSSPPSSGFSATYYHNNFSDAVQATTIDPVINLNLNNGVLPASTLSNSDVSADWLGNITAPASSTYTFYVAAQGRLTLWLNGQKIYDHVGNGSTQLKSSAVKLTKGQQYTLHVRYQGPTTGSAVAHVMWQSPLMKKTTVVGDSIDGEIFTDPVQS